MRGGVGVSGVSRSLIRQRNSKKKKKLWGAKEKKKKEMEKTFVDRKLDPLEEEADQKKEKREEQETLDFGDPRLPVQNFEKPMTPFALDDMLGSSGELPIRYLFEYHLSWTSQSSLFRLAVPRLHYKYEPQDDPEKLVLLLEDRLVHVLQCERAEEEQKRAALKAKQEEAGDAGDMGRLAAPCDPEAADVLFGCEVRVSGNRKACMMQMYLANMFTHAAAVDLLRRFRELPRAGRLFSRSMVPTLVELMRMAAVKTSTVALYVGESITSAVFRLRDQGGEPLVRFEDLGMPRLAYLYFLSRPSFPGILEAFPQLVTEKEKLLQLACWIAMDNDLDGFEAVVAAINGQLKETEGQGRGTDSANEREGCLELFFAQQAFARAVLFAPEDSQHQVLLRKLMNDYGQFLVQGLTKEEKGELLLCAFANRNAGLLRELWVLLQGLGGEAGREEQKQFISSFPLSKALSLMMAQGGDSELRSLTEKLLAVCSSYLSLRPYETVRRQEELHISRPFRFIQQAYRLFHPRAVLIRKELRVYFETGNPFHEKAWSCLEAFFNEIDSGDLGTYTNTSGYTYFFTPCQIELKVDFPLAPSPSSEPIISSRSQEGK